MTIKHLLPLWNYINDLNVEWQLTEGPASFKNILSRYTGHNAPVGVNCSKIISLSAIQLTLNSDLNDILYCICPFIYLLVNPNVNSVWVSLYIAPVKLPKHYQ